MFLYFSDWTTIENLRKLQAQGLPHSGRLVKVYANSEDPSLKLNRPVAVVQENGGSFDPDEGFKYHYRGPWIGSDMETRLDHFHLSEDAKQKARALFRFANSPEMDILELAMLVKEQGGYRYHLPLDIVHGLETALSRDRQEGLHLDIFTQRSIDRLKKVIDLENTEGLVTIRESVELARITPEGSPPTKESN